MHTNHHLRDIYLGMAGESTLGVRPFDNAITNRVQSIIVAVHRHQQVLPKHKAPCIHDNYVDQDGDMMMNEGRRRFVCTQYF
jgi:hypothetical protein